MKNHRVLFGVSMISLIIVLTLLFMAFYYAGKSAGNVEMFEKLYEADLIKEGSLKE